MWKVRAKSLLIDAGQFEGATVMNVCVGDVEHWTDLKYRYFDELTVVVPTRHSNELGHI